MSARALYVSYDGLSDSLGASQVVPYVVGLARSGFQMSVISFEKSEASRENYRHVAGALRDAGAVWWPLPYHKRPSVPATAFDIAAGTARGLAARPFDLVHARSYVAGLIGASVARVSDAKLLFDMRGFWADERIEGGIWHRGELYRRAKQVEQMLFARADAIVSLTHAARRELSTWPRFVDPHTRVPIVVIPTCADLAAYQRIPERERTGSLTIGYVGSFGGRYLLDETLLLFRELQKLQPSARLSVLTHSDQSLLFAAATRASVPRAAIEAKRVSHAEVPLHLAAMDATVCLIKPGFASIASCPTKLGESLAAGCPVVVNPGIGDSAEIVRRYEAGVVWDLSADSAPAAAAGLLELLQSRTEARARAERAAKEVFSLERGVATYRALYDRLLTGSNEHVADAFELPWPVAEKEQHGGP
ncbi:MAG: glycosyltransferase [Deltaproteobacteria bacterium]|nr:glycosyltransferase [Deltaproteobacteria bacterium]